MPQSTAALRQKAEVLRVLRSPFAAIRPVAGCTPNRPVWARKPLVSSHGTCVALQIQEGALWVRVRDRAEVEAWAPIARILTPDQRRAWAKEGFG